MTFTDAKKRARELTLPCYWPSKQYPADGPNWDNIYAHLRGEADYAASRNDQIAVDHLCELVQALTAGIRKQREAVTSNP
jgi:hypothetical protein